MTPIDALAQLGGDAAKAAEMPAYHKIDRPYLGVANPAIDAVVKGWRSEMDIDARLILAADLWDSNVHEGRVAAAKLLTQARIRPDDTPAWDLICTWVPEFDTWTIADQVAVAGAKRLVADPSRIRALEDWVASEHMWTRRAVFMMTLPWTKLKHPKPAELAVRDRIMGWAAQLVDDRDFMMQNAIAGWLRDLSKNDHDRVAQFIDMHGDLMKPFAVKEASRHLG
jgi:3-methyladenine DNA glycosylase AlkD